MIGYQRPWTSIHIDLDKTRVYVPRMQVLRFVCVYQMFVKLFTHKNPTDKYHLGKTFIDQIGELHQHKLSELKESSRAE